MHPTIQHLRSKIVAISFLMVASFHAYGQEKALESLHKALSSWPAVSQNIQIQNLANTKSPDSVRFMRATVVVFGQATTMEVEFKDSDKRNRIKRIYIAFPPVAQLSTEQFRTLLNQDFNRVMPKGLETSISFKEFEIKFDDNNKNAVHSAMVHLQFSTWTPFDGSAVTISDLSGKFSLKGLNKGPQQMEVSLDSYLLIPEDLAGTLGIGQTKLKTTGYINTEANMFSLTANLASQGIPLVTDRSVMLTEASINFAMNNGKPEFFLGGQISLEPGGKSIMPPLKGQVSIDVKGTLYGEAWMARGEWKNPFNLNPNISVTAMGLGFGINLATTPIPTPILAMEGGIIVRDKMNAIRFSGSATLVLISATQPVT